MLQQQPMRRGGITPQDDPPGVMDHNSSDRKHPCTQHLRLPKPPPLPPISSITTGSGDQPRPGNQAQTQHRDVTPHLIHPETFVREFLQSSWTALLDVIRIRPGDDATGVTATQLRAVIEELRHCGHHRAGDADVLVVMDAGYDVTRLAWLLADLPVTLIGRLRSDRVFHAPAGARQGPTKGRPPRHGTKLVLRDADTHPQPVVATCNDTARYGQTQAVAFARMHPRLNTRSGWSDHDGELPIIEGTVVGLRVEYLPGDRAPTPVWLWVSQPVPHSGAEVDHWWSMSSPGFCRGSFT